VEADKPHPLTPLIPFGVLLLLVGASFLASRPPRIPEMQAGITDEGSHYMPPLLSRPAVKVWISRDGLFVWNLEMPSALEQLPARIAAYKRKVEHRIGYAEVSAEELARFEMVAYAISELKNAGFPYVTIETKPKAHSSDPSW
jgi:biopolymer transport protein ExbD